MHHSVNSNLKLQDLKQILKYRFILNEEQENNGF